MRQTVKRDLTNRFLPEPGINDHLLPLVSSKLPQLVSNLHSLAKRLLIWWLSDSNPQPNIFDFLKTGRVYSIYCIAHCFCCAWILSTLIHSWLAYVGHDLIMTILWFCCGCNFGPSNASLYDNCINRGKHACSMCTREKALGGVEKPIDSLPPRETLPGAPKPAANSPPQIFPQDTLEQAIQNARKHAPIFWQYLSRDPL